MKNDPDKPFSLDLVFKSQLNRFIFQFLQPALESFLRIHEINDLYRLIPDVESKGSLVETLLRGMSLNIDVSPRDLSRIPVDGPVVVVANHPFGFIEGLVLISILQYARSDIKVMANSLLSGVGKFSNKLVLVNPFLHSESKSENFRAVRESITWLKEDHLLAMFPAGEVSHFDLGTRAVTDPPWSRTVAGIVRLTEAKVLPVFFAGTNGALFQMLGFIHPQLRTAFLARELMNKRNKIIKVRVGTAIEFDSLRHIPTDGELTAYLRARTFLLRFRKGRPTALSIARRKRWTYSKIKSAEENSLWTDEIQRLPPAQILLQECDYVAFHALAHQIPHLLCEIGRLREITFRSSGAGTGRSRDLDRFDSYYTHLCLWNIRANEIVGAYRLVHADEILTRFGPSGLYTSTLFDFRSGMNSLLEHGIELGRSFVRAEYQKQFRPLQYLWKGIARYVWAHHNHFNLIGAVSISSEYHQMTRGLIVEFLKSQKYAADQAVSVGPRRAFKTRKFRTADLDAATMAADMRALSVAVRDIEDKDLPVLLKQYLKLGGRFLGFSVDSSFGNTLDALIIVDLRKTDPNMLSRYMGRQQSEMFLSYHSSSERSKS